MTTRFFCSQSAQRCLLLKRIVSHHDWSNLKVTVQAKKERRRTQNINTAFADLRGCIPNVPTDTKLSKIKTLRLAISYIQHLMQQLNDERYHVVLGNSTEFPSFYQHTPSVGATERIMHNRRGMKRAHTDKMRGASQRKRGRTGWPEMVWALELNRWW